MGYDMSFIIEQYKDGKWEFVTSDEYGRNSELFALLAGLYPGDMHSATSGFQYRQFPDDMSRESKSITNEQFELQCVSRCGYATFKELFDWINFNSAFVRRGWVTQEEIDMMDWDTIPHRTSQPYKMDGENVLIPRVPDDNYIEMLYVVNSTKIGIYDSLIEIIMRNIQENFDAEYTLEDIKNRLDLRFIFWIG